MRTLSALRQGVGRTLGLRSFYSTAASSGNTTTTLVDTVTKSFPPSHFNGMYIRVTSGAGAANYTVTSWAQSTGTFTVSPATGSSSNFNSATYEVYPMHPSYMLDAINNAVHSLHPFIGRSVIDESFVTNSPLWNPGFEDWAGGTTAPVGYSATGTTMAQEDGVGNMLMGEYSVKLSGAGTGYFGLTQQHINLALSDLMGSGVTLYAWVKCDTASCARLQLGDSDGTTNGAYHTGDNTWQLINSTMRTMRGNSPPRQDSYTVKLLIDVGSGNTYIDRWWIEGGPPVYRYRVPGTMPRGPERAQLSVILNRERFQHNVWRDVSFKTRYMESNDNTGNGYTEIQLDQASVAYGFVPAFVSFGRAMMLIGRDSPKTLSADTDYLEVDEITGELVEVEAARLLLDYLAGSTTYPLNGNQATGTSNIDRVRGRLDERYKYLILHAREAGEGATLSKDL